MSNPSPGDYVFWEEEPGLNMEEMVAEDMDEDLLFPNFPPWLNHFDAVPIDIPTPPPPRPATENRPRFQPRPTLPRLEAEHLAADVPDPDTPPPLEEDGGEDEEDEETVPVEFDPGQLGNNLDPQWIFPAGLQEMPPSWIQVNLLPLTYPDVWEGDPVQAVLFLYHYPRSEQRVDTAQPGAPTSSE